VWVVSWARMKGWVSENRLVCLRILVSICYVFFFVGVGKNNFWLVWILYAQVYGELMFSVSDLLFKLNCWWVFLFFSFLLICLLMEGACFLVLQLLDKEVGRLGISWYVCVCVCVIGDSDSQYCNLNLNDMGSGVFNLFCITI